MALIGPYTTQALAEAACAEFAPTPSACCDGAGELLETHPDIELVVSGGTYGGTFTLVWGGTYWADAFVVSATDYEWRLSCAAGVWTLDLFEEGVEILDETDEPAGCDPLALSFAGATFGAEAPITAAVA